MGNGQRVNWPGWDNIPNTRGTPAVNLLDFLDTLFETHGKRVWRWESGKGNLRDDGAYYISKLEVRPKGMYE